MGHGEPPTPPAVLFQGSRKVGELRSAVREGADWIGLALISLAGVQRDSGLALSPDAVPSVQLAGMP